MIADIDPALISTAKVRSDQVRAVTGELDNSAAARQTVIARIIQEAAALGIRPREYIDHVADDSNVDSPVGGIALWSGPVPIPAAAGMSNRFLAEAWARRRTEEGLGATTTLEMTEGGRQLDEMHLFQLTDNDLRKLGFRPRSGPEGSKTIRDQVNDLWSRISARFVSQAKGPVHVFATDAFPTSVLANAELPELRTNPQVGAEQVTFAHRVPGTLVAGQLPDGQPTTVPEPLRALMDAPGRQASLQFYRPDRPGYIDLTAVGAMTPAQQETHLASLQSDVARIDQPRRQAREALAAAQVPGAGRGPATQRPRVAPASAPGQGAHDALPDAAPQTPAPAQDPSPAQRPPLRRAARRGRPAQVGALPTVPAGTAEPATAAADPASTTVPTPTTVAASAPAPAADPAPAAGSEAEQVAAQAKLASSLTSLTFATASHGSRGTTTASRREPGHGPTTTQGPQRPSGPRR